jgi:phosphohistidine phosphatase
VKVYVVRHGEAEEQRPGAGDAERELTREGRVQFEQVVGGLAALGIELDKILTSPLVRARQTAEILARVLPGPKPVEIDALAPGGRFEAVFRALRDPGSGSGVALVGHEPALGAFVSLATAGIASDSTPLKKGGVACLKFAGEPRPKGAILGWLLTPKQLRRLGEG